MRKDFKYSINQGLPGGANELKKFVKGSISVTGYKSDSPDVNNDFNIIPSNRITMQGVNFPVLGVDDLGYEQMMMPGGEYNFPGNYVTEIPQMGKGGLTQWFDEKWVDVKTGKTCGRSGKDKNSRPYPACRPSKRVNETTPKTSSELSSAEKARFKREKTSGKRINYNHKRREYGGETGWLDQYQFAGETSTADNPVRMNPIDIQAPQRSWFDRNIEAPLRKWGRSYAKRISDATGGSEWYKQPNSVASAFFSTGPGFALEAPQLSATYTATGKVQTPSEAMDIQNPYGASAVNMVLDPLGGPAIAKGLVKGLPAAARYATTQTPLKNAWVLNPRAYQYNLPENTMWRGLGQEGMEDAVSSGLFRSKQNVPDRFFPGSSLRLSKSFGTNPYFTPKFKTAATYGDNYLAEVPRDAANWTQRYKRTDWSQFADRPIPISEGRILQKDWLQGYRPIQEKKYGGWLEQYQPGGEIDPEFMFKNKYNTELTPSEEADFSKWATEESQRQGRDILNDIGAYDVKGFWKSGDYKNMDSDNHGTDTWKKPNHPTFSNQSKYHGADGWYGGNWTDKAGYQPSKQTLETYGPDYYDWMFKSEPGRSEYLDMSRYESGLNKPTPFVYQKGGRTPIYVNDPNDPRLKSYNDSLNLYNKGKSYLNQPYSNNLYDYAQDLLRLGYSRKIAPGKSKKGISDLMIPQYKKPVQSVKYRDPEIVAKQQQLIDAGYNIGTADGIWGKKSQQAWDQMSTPKQSNVNASFSTSTIPVRGMTEENVEALKKQYKDEFGANFKSQDNVFNNLQKSLGRRPSVTEYNKAIQQYNSSVNNMKYGGWLDSYQEGGHIIQPDETFYGIANKYGFNKQELINVNPGLDIDKIRPGQKINLPTVEKIEEVNISSANKKEPTSWYDYINPFNWGAPNYDDAGTFKQAFRKARIEDQNDFMYYGDRYSSDLAQLPENKKDIVKSNDIKITRDYNNDILYKGLSDVQKERRKKLLQSANKIANTQDNSEALEKLLVMTAVMENTLGADKNAYGRTYTRNPMSIDDIAYDDLFKVRKGAKDYTKSQKQAFDWLKTLGYDYRDMDKILRSDDPTAGMAAARLYYGRNTKPLPKENNKDALYNYYMEAYNKGGVDKYKGKSGYKDKWDKYYNLVFPENTEEKKYGGWLNSYQDGGQTKWLNNYK